MKTTLINKLIERMFASGKDETLKFLEDMHNRFLNRIKDYGFDTIEEYREAGEFLFNYQIMRSRRYPVTSDC